MASLIHLDGPPGIGKSTLTAVWTERRPGTLNVDLDRLHPVAHGQGASFSEVVLLDERAAGLERALRSG
jgi:hypothetical protein